MTYKIYAIHKITSHQLSGNIKLEVPVDLKKLFELIGEKHQIDLFANQEVLLLQNGNMIFFEEDADTVFTDGDDFKMLPQVIGG